MTKRGYAKILDFGLAKMRPGPWTGDRLDAPRHPDHRDGGLRPKPGATVGTVAYMSPEQARGEVLDARTDLFSFGLVLYEMATGQQAFSGRTSAVVFDAILHHAPTPPVHLNPEMPHELQRIVEKALEKDRDIRYQGAADMRADLKRLQRASAVAVAVASRPRTFAWRLWTAAVGVLAVMSLVLYTALAPRRGVAVGIGAAGRPAVAVLPFENASGSPDIDWLATGVPSMLVTGLAQVPGLDIVGSERVGEIARDLGARDPAALKRQSGAVGREAGAGALVLGSVFKTGTDVRVDVQVQDVVTGRLLGAHSVQGADVFALADDLTQRVRASLNVGGEDGRGIANVTSSSVEGTVCTPRASKRLGICAALTRNASSSEPWRSIRGSPRHTFNSPE